MDWRIFASCADAQDPDIFMTSSSRYTRDHMRDALDYCERCPVTDECLTDAMNHGDQHFSVRGGLVPGDHTEGPERKSWAKRKPYGDDIWKLFCENHPAEAIQRASDVPMSTHRTLMSKLLDERLTGAHNASWSHHRDPSHHQVYPNSGWLISATPDLYCIVVTNRRGQRLRVVRAASYVTLTPGTILSGLPLLKNWPATYDAA